MSVIRARGAAGGSDPGKDPRQNSLCLAGPTSSGATEDPSTSEEGGTCLAGPRAHTPSCVCQPSSRRVLELPAMLMSGLRRPSGHVLVTVSLVALQGGLCLPSPYQGLFCQKGEQKIGSRFGAEGHQTPAAGVVGGGAVSCAWRCWGWLRSPRSREVSIWGCASAWTPCAVCCRVGAAWEVGVELGLGGDLQFASGACGEWVGGWAGATRALPVQKRDAEEGRRGTHCISERQPQGQLVFPGRCDSPHHFSALYKCVQPCTSTHPYM